MPRIEWTKIDRALESLSAQEAIMKKASPFLLVLRSDDHFDEDTEVCIAESSPDGDMTIAFTYWSEWDTWDGADTLDEYRETADQHTIRMAVKQCMLDDWVPENWENLPAWLANAVFEKARSELIDYTPVVPDPPPSPRPASRAALLEI